MKVLIVGCGAVGQVFGLHLQNAGVEVGFFARSDSAKDLIQARKDGGLKVYAISSKRKVEHVIHRLSNYQVVTDLFGSQQFNPDQVWFTTPSTVFYSDWFKEFTSGVPAKSVVCFAPEGKREAFIPDSKQERRLVFGAVTFIAWQKGMEDDAPCSSGVNFWLPPFSAIPLVGEADACSEVADLLKEGGLKAVVRREGFLRLQAAVTALMTAFVVGYELAGWSMRVYRRSPWLKLAAEGAREAVNSQLSDAGILGSVLFGFITNRAAFYLSTLLLPSLVPFDLEKYLKFHYRKTREQTLNLLEVFIEDGQRHHLPVGKIKNLRQGLLGIDG